jgi:hypothetical protein
MRGVTLSDKSIEKIKILRGNGKSINEIRVATGHGKATISKYIKDIILPQDLLDNLSSKSKQSSLRGWAEAIVQAEKLVGDINKRDKILVLAGLYWGEGTKREMNLINSDPELIRTFVSSIQDIGITKDKLRVTLRIYEDVNADDAIAYWSRIVGVPKDQILNVNILSGKKLGKLKYGMCRIRVKKGAKYFKLIMSVIDLIRSKI